LTKDSLTQLAAKAPLSLTTSALFQKAYRHPILRGQAAINEEPLRPMAAEARIKIIN
jgi:hypothetical protein